MRYYTFFFLFFLLSQVTLAQNRSKATKFIDEVMDSRVASETASINKVFGFSTVPKSNELFYQDSVGKFMVMNMRDGFQAQKNVFRGVRNDSVYYVDSSGKRTMMERDDAQKLLVNNMSRNVIIRDRIERISSDSLIITAEERKYILTQIETMRDEVWNKKAFSKFKMIPTDTVNALFADRKRNGWLEMDKRGVRRIYNFSVPIFLRNDTYCFFCYDYSCGMLCGEGEVAIYKKINGKWQHWTTLMSWVS